jgi:hypothetical protein
MNHGPNASQPFGGGPCLGLRLLHRSNDLSIFLPLLSNDRFLLERQLLGRVGPGRLMTQINQQASRGC